MHDFCKIYITCDIDSNIHHHRTAPHTQFTYVSPQIIIYIWFLKYIMLHVVAFASDTSMCGVHIRYYMVVVWGCLSSMILNNIFFRAACVFVYFTLNIFMANKTFFLISATNLRRRRRSTWYFILAQWLNMGANGHCANVQQRVFKFRQMNAEEVTYIALLHRW